VTAANALWLDDTTEAAELAPDVRGGTVVVTGNFDGVHRGHQALFARAVAEAEARRLVPVALTFDPHPRVVLGTGAPALLTSTARRVQLVERLGVTHVFVRRFDHALAAWPPERFVRQLLVDDLHARVVVAGDNFRFGAKRSGDDALLRALGPSLGFEAFTLEATDARGPLSSSRVREAISAGDVEEGRRVLGRPHSIVGVVEAGDRLGRTLGFPTANLGQVLELPPANGVYAVAVEEVDGEDARSLATGMMNIGVRPTVSAGLQKALEVHLFDFDGDLYGRSLRVHFFARIRAEVRFESVDALKAELARDELAARALLRDLGGDAAKGAYA